jgi:chromodomain-helicase-DNA-binding protein 7
MEYNYSNNHINNNNNTATTINNNSTPNQTNTSYMMVNNQQQQQYYANVNTTSNYSMTSNPNIPNNVYQQPQSWNQQTATPTVAPTSYQQYNGQLQQQQQQQQQQQILTNNNNQPKQIIKMNQFVVAKPATPPPSSTQQQLQQQQTPSMIQSNNFTQSSQIVYPQQQQQNMNTIQKPVQQQMNVYASPQQTNGYSQYNKLNNNNLPIQYNTNNLGQQQIYTNSTNNNTNGAQVQIQNGVYNINQQSVINQNSQQQLINQQYYTQQQQANIQKPIAPQPQPMVQQQVAYNQYQQQQQQTNKYIQPHPQQQQQQHQQQQQQQIYYIAQPNSLNGYSSPVAVNRLAPNPSTSTSNTTTASITPATLAPTPLTASSVTNATYVTTPHQAIPVDSFQKSVVNQPPQQTVYAQQIQPQPIQSHQVMNVLQVQSNPTAPQQQQPQQIVYAQTNQQIMLNQNNNVMQINNMAQMNTHMQPQQQPILLTNQNQIPMQHIQQQPVLLQASNIKIITVNQNTSNVIQPNLMNTNSVPITTSTNPNNITTNNINNNSLLSTPVKQQQYEEIKPKVEEQPKSKLPASIQSNIESTIDDMMKQYKLDSKTKSLNESSDNTSDYDINESYQKPASKTKQTKTPKTQRTNKKKVKDLTESNDVTIVKLLNNGEDSLTNDSSLDKAAKTPVRTKKITASSAKKSAQSLAKLMKKTQKKKRKRTSSGEEEDVDDDSDDYEMPTVKTTAKSKEILADELAAQTLQASESRRSVRAKSTKKSKYTDEDPKLKDEDLLMPLTEAELAAEAAADAALAASADSNIVLTSQEEMIIDKILGMRLIKRKTLSKKEKKVETKAVETKPVETKPVETKPVETKPVETKPVETKPVETKPVETKPVETKPVETKPVETKPVETKPVETEILETKSVEDKPSDQIEPTVEVKSETSEPSKVEPVENKTEELDKETVPTKTETSDLVKDEETATKVEIVETKQEVKPELELDEESEYEEDGGEIEVEEFYVKYKNFSYLHCEWRSRDELFVTDKRIDQKIKRFKIKKQQQPQYDWGTDETGAGSLYNNEDDELFNPEYTVVDRVLDVFDMQVPTNIELKIRYFLIKWKSLPYDECTWELEQDINKNIKKIELFYKQHKQIPEIHQKQVQRPRPDKWLQLKESRFYKNGNQLREYQLEGISWLTFCWVNERNCILADEMGLGKTVQSVTFLHEMALHGVNGPYLILVPLSTIGNWLREFELWTDFNAVVYHGSAISRQMIQDYEFYFKENATEPHVSNSFAIKPDAKKVLKFNALITTYEVLMSDIVLFSEIKWRSCIIDEAHRLKNKNCRLMESLRYMNIEHKVLLTGTPLQNNVEELFSLLNFLEPEQFSSSQEFMLEFGDLKTDTQVNKLQAILKPMMLRRLKEDVEKNLAPKEETIVEVELTNTQKKFYRAILERNFEFLYKGTTSSNMPNLMNTMMELRKCCNHPYLINGAEEQIINEYLESNKQSREPVSPDSASLKAMIQASGKLVLVDKLLSKLKANGHRVLIFSQMIRVLDILEDYLIQMRFTYERLDGRIRGEARQEAIDRYSKPDSDRFAFLLCTRAGGLGINLTAADTVIIFDSDWNPQNDLQAQARVHRIGQKKSVKIYRLITRNTYEREMFDKASLKLGLDKAVLQSMRNEDKFNNKGAQAQAAQNSLQLSKKEIEDLLKKGAYGALMEDDTQAADKFCEQDIDMLLQQRSTVIQIEGGEKGSTFSKASFQTSETSDISIDDPEFWQKWAKKADINIDEKLNPIDERIIYEPRRRTQTKRFVCGLDELEESDDSMSTDSEAGNNNNGETTNKRNKKGDKNGNSSSNNGKWLREECYKIEKNLLVFGWSQWTKILENCEFSNKKNKTNIQSEKDVESLSRCILAYALRNYQGGDEQVKQYVIDLIDPFKSKFPEFNQKLSLTGPNQKQNKTTKIDIQEQIKLTMDFMLNKICDDNLHATKLNSLDWAQNSDDLLMDENYKKHLSKHSTKMLFKIKTLAYIKTEIITDENLSLIDANTNESEIKIKHIDMPEILTDLPCDWWNKSCDKSLIIGVYKYGYEKFYNMRLDPSLCFLSLCGPPDAKDLLAEQQGENQDDDFVNHESADEEEQLNKKQKKSSKRAAASKKKIKFPSVAELNNRLRRLIALHQKSKKQELLQQKKEAERLEKLKHKQQFNQEKLVIKQMEKQKWSKREEQMFQRTVCVFGVDCLDKKKQLFNWTQFKEISQLDKKLDETLTDYYQLFYSMCSRVANNKRHNDSSNQCEVISEDKAVKCLQRIEFLNKVRQFVLKHVKFTKWMNSKCAPSADLPDWWINGKHDVELVKAAAKYGLIRTDYYYLNDVEFSFKQSLQKFTQHIEFLMKKEKCDIQDNIQYYIQNQTRIKQTFTSDKKSTMNIVNEVLNELVNKIENDSSEPIQYFSSQQVPLHLWPKDRALISRLENIIQMFENNGEWPKIISHSAKSVSSNASSADESEQASSCYLEPGEITTTTTTTTATTDNRNQNNKRTRKSMMPEPVTQQPTSLQSDSSAALAALFLAPGLNLNDRITVINIENGTRLTGNKAPKRAELPMWLMTHPNYLPDESEIVKLTTQRNAIEQQQQQQQQEQQQQQPKPSKQFKPNNDNHYEEQQQQQNNYYPDIILFNKQNGKKITNARVPNWKSLCLFFEKNQHIYIDPSCNDVLKAKFGRQPIPDIIKSRLILNSKNNNNNNKVTQVKQTKENKEEFNSQFDLNNPLATLLAAMAANTDPNNGANNNNNLPFGGNPFLLQSAFPDLFKDALSNQMTSGGAGGLDMNTLEALAISLTNNSNNNKTKGEDNHNSHNHHHNNNNNNNQKSSKNNPKQQVKPTTSKPIRAPTPPTPTPTNSKRSTRNNEHNKLPPQQQPSAANDTSSALLDQEKFMQDMMNLSQLTSNPFLSAAGLSPFNFMLPQLAAAAAASANANNGSRSTSPSNENQSISPSSSIASSLSTQQQQQQQAGAPPPVDFNLLTNLMNLQMMNGLTGANPFMPSLPSMPNDILAALAAQNPAFSGAGAMAGFDSSNILNALALLNGQNNEPVVAEQPHKNSNNTRQSKSNNSNNNNSSISNKNSNNTSTPSRQQVSNNSNRTSNNTPSDSSRSMSSRKSSSSSSSNNNNNNNNRSNGLDLSTKKRH